METLSSICRFVPIALALIAFSQLSTAAPQIQAGVVPSPGSEGIAGALAEHPEMQVVDVQDVDIETLAKIDILVLGAAQGLPGTPQSSARNVRAFVRAGGAVILHHNSTGYGDWPEPLFPEAGRGSARSESTAVHVSAESPLTADLPADFKHAYFDHITLTPGDAGEVLVADEVGDPVVITAQIREGRVVLNGMATGLDDNVETAPEGAEMQLLVNAVRWATETPLTALEPVERQLRISQVLNEMLLSEKAQERDRASNTSWYTKQMLNEAYITRPPVEQLDGRFFLFAHRYTYNYGYERTRMNCRQLRWLGVTDIVIHDQSGARINHPTEIPGARPRFTDRDPLMDLVKGAHEEGLNVWAFCHSGEYPPEMCAKDAEGNLYLRTNGDGIDDVFSEDLRGFLGHLLDEYAQKYNKYGNFKGIYYDEIFFNSVDCHGDDVERFAEFCQERFGERPPDDIGKRFALGRNWVEPENAWWRRYVLFRNWGTAEFLSDLTEMCHDRDLKMIVELRPTVGLSGWRMGLDNVALTRIGADRYFVASGDYCEPGFAYPDALVGGHVYGRSWGYWNTLSLRGHDASVYFAFNQLWRPLVIGLNPHKPEAFGRFVQNQREWSNADSLTRAALLTNEIGMILRHGDTEEQSENELRALDRFSHYQDLDLVYAQASELHPNYRVLVALPESTEGLGPENIKALRGYVQEGGVIISLGSRWSTARADLSDEEDITGEITGVRITGQEDPEAIVLGDTEITLDTPALTVEPVSGDVEILATMKPSGNPAVTVRSLGDGKIIAVHLDPYLFLQDEPTSVEEFLADLIAEYSRPEIRGSGETKIVTTLKKGNWVAVSLFAQDFPAHGTVSVDAAALDLPGEEFRLISHARNREYGPPGKFTNEVLWNRDMISQGVEVTIPLRSDLDLDLPSDLGAEDYADEPLQNEEWLNEYLRGRWDGRRGQGRHYEYEILVVGPPDEVAPKMPLE